MATRGIYKVENVLLYNHWDNYPSGAANHFIEVIRKSGNLSLFSVIRGMDRTEPADSIFYGGAEYYYEIEKDRISCYKLGKEKVLISCNSIVNWINDNVREILEESDNVEDYTIVQLSENKYSTVSQVREDATKLYNKGKDCTDKGMMGNGSSCFSDAFRLFNKAGINFDELKNEFIEIYSPLFVKSYKHNDSTYFDSLVNR